jgi:hypothetical protein
MEEFAIAFGYSNMRKSLIRNLIGYRALMRTGGFVSGIQFLNGSFLENVEATQGRDPQDIDVFSLVSLPPAYQTNAQAWSSTGLPFWRDEVVNQPLNKQRYSLDTYADIYPQPGLSEIKTIIYWYSLFAHQRVTMEWKGFVAVPLDAASDANALAIL